MLMLVFDDGTASAIARFEDHKYHPETHVHSHCKDGGVVRGPTSISGLTTCLPEAGKGARRRQNQTWTPESFWSAAKRFFRFP